MAGCDRQRSISRRFAVDGGDENNKNNRESKATSNRGKAREGESGKSTKEMLNRETA